MRDRFPTYPLEIQGAIKNHQVIEGMDGEQVYLALGVTFCKSSSYYRGVMTEMWSYQLDPFTGRPAGGTFDCSKTRFHVHFVNGRVVGWSSN